MRTLIHIPLFTALGVLLLAVLPNCARAQGGDKAMKIQADLLFDNGEYAKAYPLYSQLVSLSPQDHELNYKFGTCTLYGGDDKEKAIGYLKFAVTGPATPSLAWYFLGRAYQLGYHFDDAIGAYQHYRGTADKKLLVRFPVDAMEQQCRNGKFLLSNLKDIQVLSKVQVDASDFFRFYDLSDIGGKIVVTPDELLTNYDRKSGEQFLTYLPTGGGVIYFSSYGKDGRTGKDIYRSEVLPTGGYATPVKLAGYINTPEDEDNAVMAPDGKTFYFCSKGHNSMGGYDVFKSTYDKGMDTFGAPENMDFAVNTPADELLYIVGPDGKQACFASNRDSKQGMLNVYRVGTTQTPINITVLKGTYASALDPTDRRARIIVEDAITRERVADVTTDINGSYLLALPRGGKYKFLVEGGSSGLTHLETVDVPPNEHPKVFKQEIQLVDRGGEKAVIKNYFDQPLEDDVMALALDEIKRRAKLDVTSEKPADATVTPLSRSDEPLQAAGFDGTMTMTKAQDLARKDAEELQELAKEQDLRSKAAYSMALKNVTTAEAAAKRARELLKQADAAANEGEKDPVMRQAAQVRQFSHEANERARAAYRTASELGDASRTTSKDAATAKTLASGLGQAQMAGDKEMSTTLLKQLKARIDRSNGPDVRMNEAERTRLAASAAEVEASKKMKQATAQREDESLLAERAGRLQAEATAAKGSKKENLNAQLAVLAAQRSALQDETEKAFAKARDAEDDAAVLRGQAQLVRYLNGDPNTWKDSTAQLNDLTGLEQRLSDVRTGNKALAIDERYAPIPMGSAQERELRTFDWGTTWSVADVLNGNYLAVSKSKPKGDVDHEQQAENITMADQRIGPAKSVEDTGLQPVGKAQAVSAGGENPPGHLTNSDTLASMATVPDGSEESRSANAIIRSGTGSAGIKADHPQVDDQAEVLGSSGRVTSSDSKHPAPNATGNVTGSPENSGIIQSGDLKARDSEGKDADARLLADSTVGDIPLITDAKGVVPSSSSAVKALNEDHPAASNSAEGIAAVKDQDRDEARKKGEAGTTDSGVQAMDADEQAFILGNKLAELQQLRNGERSKVVRDSLDTLIAEQRTLIGTYQTVHSGGLPGTMPLPVLANSPVDYQPLEFDLSTLNEQLAEEAYPGFELRRQEVMNGPGDARDKANMLHALEMGLVDSIDARTAKDLGMLDRHPELADRILPRLERWGQLKATHVNSAAAALAEVDKEYVASESRSMEDAQLSGQAVKQPSSNGKGNPATPHNDAYVTIASDLAEIYSSSLVPRSKKDTEAVALKDKDLQQVAVDQAVIDSLRESLSDMPSGKNYDKLRQRIEKKVDDVLILNVEIGQRMAFISKSEYDVAKDSSKVLEKALAKKGLPPDEPLLQMVKSFQGAAEGSMGKAKAFRKDADQTGDIVQRNSLYRQAYGEELKALRDYDRSLTIRNYLLSGQASPGEVLTYEQVEARMFGQAIAALPESGNVSPGSHDAPDAKDPAATAMDSIAHNVVEVVPVISDDQRKVATLQDRPMPVPAARDTTKRVDQRESISVSSPLAQRGDSSMLSDYLEQYYYLSPAERSGVMGDVEKRKYFLMKGRAMEDLANADAARVEADGAAKLASELKGEATDSKGVAGTSTTNDVEKRVGSLNTRGDALLQRSDSLKHVSERLIAIATSTDAQAAILMQGMPAERSAAIMDLEQGRRRTEPTLARTRPSVDAAEPAAVNDHVTIAEVRATGTSEPPVSAEQARSEETMPASLPIEKDAERIARVTSVVGNAPVAFVTPLINDDFKFAETETPRKEAIPIDVPMPVGVVYKVQVGAFRNALPTEAFSDMTPVTGEHAGNGLLRYTAGMFTSADAASKAGAKVRARGYRDAFVVAYMDGKRVPLQEAMRAEREIALPAIAAQAQVPVPVGTTARPTTATSTTAAPNTQTVSTTTPGSTTVQVPQADAEAAVLAAYPASAEEVLAGFKPSSGATGYYNDPTAAPAKQVEAVKGLFFTVQVGVYSKPTPLDKLFNITPLNSELTASQKIRYTTGIFLDEGNAVARKNGTVTLGVSDAFVTAYLNGKRIPLGDARALLSKFGRSVLVDPAIATQ